mgnify:CR=1 FL=1
MRLQPVLVVRHRDGRREADLLTHGPSLPPSPAPPPSLPPPLAGKHTVFGRLVGGLDVLAKLERVPTDAATDRPLKPVVLQDVEVFGDPFDEYKKRLDKRLKREEDERLGRGEKERRREERAKDRTTCVGSLSLSLSRSSPRLLEQVLTLLSHARSWFGTNLETSSPAALALASSSSTGASIGKYLASSSSGTSGAAPAAPAPIGGAGLKRKTPALGGAESDLVAKLGEAGDSGGGGTAAAKRKKKAGGFSDFSAW